MDNKPQRCRAEPYTWSYQASSQRPDRDQAYPYYLQAPLFCTANSTAPQRNRTVFRGCIAYRRLISHPIRIVSLQVSEFRLNGRSNQPSCKVTDMNTQVSQHTETELVNYLNSISHRFTSGSRLDALVFHFDKSTEHPGGINLIFYPGDEAEGSAEEIIETIKTFCRVNGLLGFELSEI
ncbi:bacteriocin immunity protein [Pseudomonas sp. NPDC098747]|uniref:bacteriocin immunity protein n=1 Tax=Pseudomonas sp. NPDC098747 TaxID=3364487 RepID=UPI00383A4971